MTMRKWYWISVNQKNPKPRSDGENRRPEEDKTKMRKQGRPVELG
jgi:hypothetical protein